MEYEFEKILKDKLMKGPYAGMMIMGQTDMLMHPLNIKYWDDALQKFLDQVTNFLRREFNKCSITRKEAAEKLGVSIYEIDTILKGEISIYKGTLDKMNSKFGVLQTPIPKKTP